MRQWAGIVWLLVRKEIRLEWRSKELITLLACNATLLAVLVGAGVSSAVLDSPTREKIFPMLLWVVFMLSSTTSVVRFNEQELEGRGFEGLLLAGVTGAQMFFSKLLVMSACFFANFLLLLGLFALSLDYDISDKLGSLATTGLGASVVLASLLTLLAAVASTSKLKGVLLPIISLPLLFPIFLCGMEMTTELVLGNDLAGGAPWPVILLCAQAVYFVAGINFFEVAVRE